MRVEVSGATHGRSGTDTKLSAGELQARAEKFKDRFLDTLGLNGVSLVNGNESSQHVDDVSATFHFKQTVNSLPLVPWGDFIVTLDSSGNLYRIDSSIVVTEGQAAKPSTGELSEADAKAAIRTVLQQEPNTDFLTFRKIGYVETTSDSARAATIVAAFEAISGNYRVVIRAANGAVLVRESLNRH